jgi:hypothetical protein
LIPRRVSKQFTRFGVAEKKGVLVEDFVNFKRAVLPMDFEMSHATDFEVYIV